MINKKKAQMTRLIARFWKSVPGFSHTDGMQGSFGPYMEEVSVASNVEQLYDTDKFKLTKYTIGDFTGAAQLRFNNIRFCREHEFLSCNIVDFFECKVLWDCDGKIKPEERIYRAGPCMYKYPDGSVAGLEMYELDFSFDLGANGRIMSALLYDENGTRLEDSELFDEKGNLKDIDFKVFDDEGRVVTENALDRLPSIYFDPKGNRISQSEFDVIFRKEWENAGLKTELPFNYAPRVESYNGLIKDLWFEMYYGGGRIEPAELRDFHLAHCSDEFLDMMASDLRRYNESQENSMKKEFLEGQIRLYVYGEDPRMVNVRVNKILEAAEELYRTARIDSSLKEVKYETDGSSVTIIGDPNDKAHCLYRDPEGRLIRDEFIDKERGCPVFIRDYYPNGNLFRYQVPDKYTPDLLEYDVILDKKLRLSSYSVASLQYQEAWEAVRIQDKSKEVKQAVKQTKI